MNQAVPHDRARRVLIWLTSSVVLAVAAWSVVWWMITETIDEKILAFINNAAVLGTEIECGNRAISGWPFRVHVSCTPLRIRLTDGRSVSLPAARAVALIYKPRHVIVEGDAPADIAFAGNAAPGAIAWTLGHASLHLADDGPEAISVSLTDPRLSGFGPIGVADASAAVSELHVRRTPETAGNIDVAVRIDGLTESPLAQGAPMAVDIRASVPAAVLASPAGVSPVSGRSDAALRITNAGISSATARLAVSGTISLAPSGRPDGTLTLTAAGPDDLKSLLTRILPAEPEQLDAVQGTVFGLGRKTEENGVVQHELQIAIKDGAASIGLIPIGTLPSLRR